MLSVEEALERALSSFQPLPPEHISILETLGRVVTEDVFADMDIPPLADTSMDGYAVLAENTFGASQKNPVIPGKDKRRHYVRVMVERENSEYKAHPTGDQGSGILLSMVRSQGLAIIPEDVDHLPVGTRVPVMMLDWPEVRFPLCGVIKTNL